MPSGITIVAIAALASSMGCAAIRYPAPLSGVERSAALSKRLPRWTVGVREPRIRYDSPGVSGPGLAEEIDDAAHLIAVLRKTELFARVDFTKQLGCTPDLELVVRVHEGPRLEPPSLWIWLVSMSIVLEEEEGIFFAPASAPDVVFEFPYQTTFMVGLFPLIASPVLLTPMVPTWSLMSSREAADELKVRILASADRLRPYLRERDRDSCRSGQSSLPLGGS